MEEYIKGHYRKSIFTSEAGYYIGLFKVKECSGGDLDIYLNKTLTFTGYFPPLSENDTYIFYGNLVNHEKYGEQFNVTRFDVLLLEEKNSIVEFLSSGIFKGIGQKKAEKIVDVLGDKTLEIILENPSNLTLIPTVTEKNITELHDKLIKYRSSYQTILKLTSFGFNPKDSISIYTTYLDETLEMIEKDIYQITYDINTLNFIKVDIIALKMNILKNDIRRIKSAIIYVMNELCFNSGHSYLKYNEIANYSIKVLRTNIDKNEFDIAINELVKEKQIVIIEEEYYLTNFYEAECNIVNRFNYLNSNKSKSITKVENKLIDLEKYFNITYNQEQKEAIIQANVNDFLIITGGPGTGKTTIISSIVELYRIINNLDRSSLLNEVALLAPTGRAAKRIASQTLFPASTIHKYLKWDKETGKFQINEHNKTNDKLIIVDESSMIDVLLLDSLLKGIKSNTKIILVGDKDQLPSVGPGEVLKELIESKMLNVIFLKEIYRQDEDSSILSLAYAINNNDLSDENLINSSDLEFIETNSENTLHLLKKMLSNYKEHDYHNLQILCPMYKTANGIDNLNKITRELFNPETKNKNSIEIDEEIYREGDKVIQLTNMPEEDIYNGDIGIIESIKSYPKKEVIISFDTNTVKYTPSNFSFFKHAYAISIHKAQGSEFDIVIMPFLMEYKKMLYRKLIYTGVTRAKKKLIILGDFKALLMASQNNNEDVRRSNIKLFLINGIKLPKLGEDSNGI